MLFRSQFAFDRVNSFISGGFAAELDEDLMEKTKEPTGKLKDACWTGYTAVGMKMKNGRKVPNCVPIKEQLKPVPSIDKIADKFNKSENQIEKAIKTGSKIEKEHTKNKNIAMKIATAHVNERPDYYTRLKKVEESKKIKIPHETSKHLDRKSTRLNSSHVRTSRMPSSA